MPVPEQCQCVKRSHCGGAELESVCDSREEGHSRLPRGSYNGEQVDAAEDPGEGSRAADAVAQPRRECIQYVLPGHGLNLFFCAAVCLRNRNTLNTNIFVK